MQYQNAVDKQIAEAGEEAHRIPGMFWCTSTRQVMLRVLHELPDGKLAVEFIYGVSSSPKIVTPEELDSLWEQYQKSGDGNHCVFDGVAGFTMWWGEISPVIKQGTYLQVNGGGYFTTEVLRVIARLPNQNFVVEDRRELKNNHYIEMSADDILEYSREKNADQGNCRIRDDNEHTYQHFKEFLSVTGGEYHSLDELATAGNNEPIEITIDGTDATTPEEWLAIKTVITRALQGTLDLVVDSKDSGATGEYTFAEIRERLKGRKVTIK